MVLFTEEFNNLAEEEIPEWQFQWFIDIVSYLQFVTGKIVSTYESQRDEVHATNVRNTKDQNIIISDFNMDVPPLLGFLGKVKETLTPQMAISMPELQNAHENVRGLFPRAYKYLQ